MSATLRLRLRNAQPRLGSAIGLALLLLAAGLRFVFGGLSQGFGPMTFLPAILLAGLVGGFRIGSMIAALSIVVGWGWFFPPYGTLILSSGDRISMGVFIVTAGLELYVVHMLRLTMDDLSSAESRSSTLFRELQHRVANNLQSVAAFLYLRKKTLEPDSAGAHALEAAQDRLTLMSDVHRRLNNPSSIDQPLGSYLEELCADLIAASNMPNIRSRVEAASIEFDLESTHDAVVDRRRTGHQQPQARLPGRPGRHHHDHGRTGAGCLYVGRRGRWMRRDHDSGSSEKKWIGTTDPAEPGVPARWPDRAGAWRRHGGDDGVQAPNGGSRQGQSLTGKIPDPFRAALPGHTRPPGMRHASCRRLTLRAYLPALRKQDE
jgi:hypothetical protein